MRENLRQEKAEQIKERFLDMPLDNIVFHWDGKMMNDFLNREQSDRIAVIVTNNDFEKLLGVPELENSSGETLANALFDVLEDWQLGEKIKAFCCDSAATNLGPMNGAAVLLEQMLRRDILYLPCRHHVRELILRAAWEKKFPGTVGPDVALFKRFKIAWNNIDKGAYRIGVDDEILQGVLQEKRDEIYAFTRKMQRETNMRGDYRELLELTEIFLGFVPPNYEFHYPGAMSHARWMSKAIYVLKIYLFRDVFHLSAGDTRKLGQVCVFIVLLYVKDWFTCSLATSAPNNDLTLLKNLHQFWEIDREISEVTVKKFLRHLWYLTPECAALAFFDTSLSVETRRRMVDKLTEEPGADYGKRFIIDFNGVEDFIERDIDYFINSQSMEFFTRFGLYISFLNTAPEHWERKPSYVQSRNIVKNLKVVNDTAERNLKLIQDYNNCFTQDGEQKKYILQVLEDYRSNYGDSKKETLLKDY